MRIGIAAPISVNLIADLVSDGDQLPSCWSFPFLALLARAVFDRGHEVTVFALSEEVTSRVTFSGDRFRIVICPRRSSTHHMMLDLQRTERRHLCAAMQEADCEVIHAHWTYDFAWAALDSGRPTAITAHDNPWWVLWYHRHPYRIARLQMARGIARSAQVMTGVSPYVETHWRKTMGYRGNFTVVPNGLPADSFVERAKTLSPQQDPVLFATLTGWGRRKNGATLIRAFAQVSQYYPQAKLIIFGNGHGLGGPAEACARAAGCLQQIDLRGQRPYAEVLSCLQNEATLFVHPALEESFGLSHVEAMAAGIPVIGGRFSGAVAWTLDQGKAGWLCDMRSPDELARTIVTAIRQYQSTNQRAEHALTYAREQFSLSTVCDQYLAVYEATLACSS